MEFHKLTVEETVQHFNTNLKTGLSRDQITTNLERYGLNELPKQKHSTYKKYFAPLFNWLIVVYIVSSTLLLLLGQGQLTVVTIIVVMLNGLAVIIQQFRAQRALEALQKMVAPTTTVIRESKRLSIDTSQVLIGDIVVLDQGDRVPADARLFECNSLIVNEASLTGETEPVVKDESCSPIYDEAPIYGRSPMGFGGTIIFGGNGQAIVVKTGPDTEIGKISLELNELTVKEIPLLKKINHFAKYLAISVVILFTISLSYQAFFLFINNALKPEIFVQTLIMSISTAMNIMPINIPLLTTLILLTGVLSMAQTGVIIRNLGAIDSLGRISVLCTDKTGTLTKNQMTVRHIWANNKIFNVTGEGYEPKGELILVGKDFLTNSRRENQNVIHSLDPYPELKTLIISGILNNNADLIIENKDQQINQSKTLDEKCIVIGAPTEGAILTLASKAGIDFRSERANHKVLKEHPFNSIVKRMTKVYHNKKSLVAYTKGASEVILPRCNRILLNNRKANMTHKIKSEVERVIEYFASRGFRVLSFAFRDLKKQEYNPTLPRDEIEKELVYLGFVCISDPPRPKAREAVDACEAAGITVVMITGDSKITARNVAEELNILQPHEKVVDGHEAKNLDVQTFVNTAVFARVSPKDKQVIIDRYQNQIHRVVAMTGDGVNDALALSMADIGISMGITGTDVAKESSDMIISDDSFITIKEGIRQGRSLFNKIRSVIYFYIIVNILEASIFFGAALIPGFEMFTYWQLIMLYLTAHSLPPLATVFDRPDKNVMKEKSRNSEEIITKHLLYTMIVHAVLMGIGIVLIYYLTLTGIIPLFPENLIGILSTTVSYAQQKARTLCMAVILITEAFVVLSVRRLNQSIVDSMKNDFFSLFPLMIGLVFASWCIMVYIPITQEIMASIGLGLEWMFLSEVDWILIILFSLPGIVGFELYKLWCRNNNIRF